MHQSSVVYELVLYAFDELDSGEVCEFYIVLFDGYSNMLGINIFTQRMFQIIHILKTSDFVPDF